MEKKTTAEMREHNAHVIRQMRSNLNRWGTGEEIGHSPELLTIDGRNALAQHFIASGGAKRLSKSDGFKID